MRRHETPYGPTRYDRAYRHRAARHGDDYRAESRSAHYADMYGRPGGRYGTPFPGAAGYPSARFGWGPIGWAGWVPGDGVLPELAWMYGVPYGAPWYGSGEIAPHRPPRPPRESPGYGRGGDCEVRRWAREHGYDASYTIRPHPSTRYR